MRLALLIAAISVALQAQQQPPPDPSKPLLQVQGVALDKDTRQPVAGADVIVSATGAPASRGPPATPATSKSRWGPRPVPSPFRSRQWDISQA